MKEIDYSSLEIDGIDPRDYPDFVDAYISNGYHKDGTSISDEDLEILNEDRDLVYNLILELLYWGKYMKIHKDIVDGLKRIMDKKSDENLKRCISEISALYHVPTIEVYKIAQEHRKIDFSREISALRRFYE